ncbi:hypothetical protein FD755_004857 [Muntiacus reevesi]|uniref:Uncharacterized protein n=1 Tax=Muntiacus reevesi TaxID=9886 RepID=A0A5J5MRS3_MUNRE|nr:hypothetical protein FD755_004857 [Muntiacus reevesi]
MMISGIIALSLLVLLLALPRRGWVKSGRLDRALMELSGRWGPVFTVCLGPRPALVLCGYAALRDALVLQADAFSGRRAMAVFERFTRGNEFGLGMRTIEERVLEEAACLLGAPFEPQRLLDNAVSNVICSMVFGNRYGNEDMEFLRLLDLFNDNFRIMSSRWGEIYIFSSLLDWLPELRVSIPQQIQLPQQMRQPGKPRNFIDSFLDQIDKHLSSVPIGTEEPGEPFRGRDVGDDTVSSCGTETTSTTLRYGLLILLKYPEVVARLNPGLSAPALHQRCAARDQRFISMVVSGLPRALTCVATPCPSNLGTSPQGTFVIPLLVSAHQDPTQFKDPECFNPTNFLNDQGEFQSNNAFMPFALGRALACMGFSLHTRVPRKADVPGCRPGPNLTSILLWFCLLPVGSRSDTDLAPQCPGLSNVPPAFQLRLVAR